MKSNHAAFIVFAAILSIFTAETCNSKSSVLNFLPAILSKNIEAKETFRLSPKGTQYTGSEELSFLSIDFPEFAVEQADVVNVASYKRYSKAIGNINIIKAFSIRPAEQDIFRKPVSVTVALDSMPENAMPFYVDNDGHIWPMAIKEKNAQSITFYTQHASDFLITKLLSNITKKFDTGFDPSEDGFQIKNFGDTMFEPDGNCAGMAFFSVYHFLKNKTTHGGLYNNFMNDIYGVQGYKEQHLIAGYAQKIYSNQIKNFIPSNNFSSNNIEMIANYMLQTGNPTVITVFGQKNGQSAGGHAMVAFGYDLLDNNITVYDPNHPNVEYKWKPGTIPLGLESAWDSVEPNFYMFGGTFQLQIAKLASDIYQAEGPTSDIMDIATSKVNVTTPGDGWIDYIDYNNGNGFYIRGSIDKNQIFPPERITFNIYNGREQVTCLAQYYDLWDFSYIYDDTPDKSVTVDVDPTTGTFEAIVDYEYPLKLDRWEKLEAVAHVTVDGEEIQLKTNIWKADGTAVNFDTYLNKLPESNFDQCEETWNCIGRNNPCIR